MPSSFIISQITPPGSMLANIARSTAASVCPALLNTPPSLASKGKTCPGLRISSLRESGLIATAIVRARSAAEIPVETPSEASMLMVKLVPIVALLLLTIKGRFSLATVLASRGRQISPLPNFAMKLTFSAVAASAAQIRSPSFSRSSSSTTTIRSPLAMALIASSIELNLLFVSTML